jgi:hypothetical protein
MRCSASPTEATPVVLEGDSELGRIVAEPDAGRIEDFLKLAL